MTCKNNAQMVGGTGDIGTLKCNDGIVEQVGKCVCQDCCPEIPQIDGGR